MYDSGGWRDLGWAREEKREKIPVGAVLKRVNAGGVDFYIATGEGLKRVEAEKVVRRAQTPFGEVTVLAWRVETPRGVFVDKVYKAPSIVKRWDWVGPHRFAAVYRKALEEEYRRDLNAIEDLKRRITARGVKYGLIPLGDMVDAYLIHRARQEKWSRLGRRLPPPIPEDVAKEIEEEALRMWFRLEGLVRKAFEKAREKGLDWAEYLVPRGRALYPAAPSRHGEDKAYYKKTWRPVLEADEPLLEDAARAGLVFGWRRLYRARKDTGLSTVTLHLEPYTGRLPLLGAHGIPENLAEELERTLEEKRRKKG